MISKLEETNYIHFIVSNLQKKKKSGAQVKKNKWKIIVSSFIFLLGEPKNRS